MVSLASSSASLGYVSLLSWQADRPQHLRGLEAAFQRSSSIGRHIRIAGPRTLSAPDESMELRTQPYGKALVKYVLIQTLSMADMRIGKDGVRHVASRGNSHRVRADRKGHISPD